MANRTVTKREICERIAKQNGWTAVQVKDVVQTFMDAVTDHLSQGNRMEFRNFAVLESEVQEPRKARNPRTGKTVHLPEKVKVSFTAGKKMREKAQEALSDFQQRISQSDAFTTPAGSPDCVVTARLSPPP